MVIMRLSTDFTVIPEDYGKQADDSKKTDGIPVVSFPFYINGINPQAHYLHWEFVDDDSIPVCGFQWIHWSVANLPLDALMYDFNDSQALQIPEDFSRQLPAMIPEAVQGRNSQASRFVGSVNPSVFQRYNGPQPPDRPHDYMLTVYATIDPLLNLREGFWLSELRDGLRASRSVVDSDAMWLTGEN
ncbi:Raf-like protein [Scardovia inopinata]|uniref:YbhB/YbcL family Raf kinase inhibitor-like protein n=2 Tax=Scardovia inopinata TaxID=78259 RepID=W5IGM5_SCAIO|nr:YbhB/YbcL family Raf kinase inhibitor-like protein [Scardovia inopinata F0304]SUV51434.1 Raf-like protein [Scardovia inopinata]